MRKPAMFCHTRTDPNKRHPTVRAELRWNPTTSLSFFPNLFPTSLQGGELGYDALGNIRHTRGSQKGIPSRSGIARCDSTSYQKPFLSTTSTTSKPKAKYKRALSNATASEIHFDFISPFGTRLFISGNGGIHLYDAPKSPAVPTTASHAAFLTFSCKDSQSMYAKRLDVAVGS